MCPVRCLPSTTMSTAVQFKDEGNKLYVARDYAAAYIKYSKAIELDGTVAMFWANRAACLLAMKRCVCVKWPYMRSEHTDQIQRCSFGLQGGVKGLLEHDGQRTEGRDHLRL